MKFKIGRIKHSKNPDKGGYVYLNSEDHTDHVRVDFAPDGSKEAMEIAKKICDQVNIKIIRNNK